MVLATGQQAEIQKQKRERKLQSYRATCFSYSFLFWHSAGSSKVQGDGEQSNISGSKSVGISHQALLSYVTSGDSYLHKDSPFPPKCYGARFV